MDVAGLVTVRVKADLTELDRGLADGRKKSEAFGREAPRAFRGVDSAAKEAGRSIKGVASQAAVANDNVRVMGASSRIAAAGMRQMASAGAAFGVAMAAAFSLSPAFAFQDALAEVSTLVDTATFDMQGLEQAALKQAAAFGGGGAPQAKAFYQIISAGASSAAQATDTLTAANLLAVGGVTSVTTAADGLTSVLNAYGSKVEGATAVSDALFVGMRAGKTTIGELSSSLGQVAPLAAQTGVTFDELVASISALTKGGIATSEAVTGVRAILAAVAKPTVEASKAANALGLDFSAAGLASKGFAGFIGDIQKKTGGSTEALSLLFGGVEALVPIMALSGQAGVDFTAILEQMGDKAGATAEAFAKMEASPSFQAGRVWSALQSEILGSSSALSDGLVVAMKFTADNMGRLVGVVKVVGAALLVAFAPTILSMMAAGFVAIGTAGVAAFTAITVAIAANPLGAILVAITTIITALYVFRDDIKEVFGVDVVATAKGAANAVIGAFVGGYHVVMEQWRNLPTLFSALGKQAYNSLVSEFEKPALAINGMTIIPGLDLSSMKSDLTDAEKSSLSGATATFNKDFNRDYIGDRFGGVAESAGSAAASIAKVTDASTSAALALGETDKAAAKTKNSYDEIVRSANQFIAAQQLEASVIGLTEQAASRLRFEQDLLNQAANDNIKLTPKQKEELMGLAAGMAAAEAETKRLTDAYDFQKDVLKGVFSDFRSALDDGKLSWQDLGNVAISVLDKITDKLLNDVIDAIMQVNGAGSGGGGFLSSLLGMFGGGGGGAVDPWAGMRMANGGAFSGGNVIPFATGGIVGSPTQFPMSGGRTGLMGEAGPEGILPLRRNSAGQLGVMASGASNNNQPQSTHVTVGVSVDNNGNLQAFVKSVARGESQAAIKSYDKTGAMRIRRDSQQAGRRGIA
ncbi:phage tail tape measure protein [Brucella endophytica]